MKISEKLSKIQVEFKSNKSKYNSFGKYNFRSAEDILEALKPFNDKYKVHFTINEKLLTDGVIKSIAKIIDNESLLSIKATAIVGVDFEQKGMQVPQKYGSASSYGKKYALGNLLLIDDTQDSDATNTHGKTNSNGLIELKKDSPEFTKAKAFLLKGGDISKIKAKYSISESVEKLLVNN